MLSFVEEISRCWKESMATQHPIYELREKMVRRRNRNRTKNERLKFKSKYRLHERCLHS
jgi:hypothetical protein